MKTFFAAAAGLAGIGLLSVPANATVYTLDITTTHNTVVDLNITANSADLVLTSGLDIVGVTGTVGGVAVSNYTGVWGGNGDQVSGGLYVDPFQNQNPAHLDSNGTNVFTVQILRVAAASTPKLITYFTHWALTN